MESHPGYRVCRHLLDPENIAYGELGANSPYVGSATENLGDGEHPRSYHAQRGRPIRHSGCYEHGKALEVAAEDHR